MKKISQKLIVMFFILGLFTTLVNTTNAASSVSFNTNEATLNGSVNPEGSHTTSWFEWGTDSNLDTWNETNHIYIGATNYAMPVSTTLVNLNKNTTYYYRVVSENNQNINKGNISSFNTNSSGKITRSNTKNNITRSTIHRSQNANLSAGAVFGTNSLPNNILGWLILILIIVCIIAVIRRLIQK